MSSLREKGDFLEYLPKTLGQVCLHVAKDIQEAGGRAVLVGGCVRDFFLKHEPKDIDIEVFGIPSNDLERILLEHFHVIHVGKAFCVYKIKGHEIDVSMPRRERKTDIGHKGFEVEGDPTLSFEEAASRRDFTINSISWDPLSKQIIDPFNGIEDIKKRQLRHTTERFSEDPLRVLRAMQFTARFNLEICAETIALCASIKPHGLPRERIFTEWSKLILKALKPSLGLAFLKECGWITYYPELEALIGCPQDPEWHPEGDAWVHTLHCMDCFAQERVGNDWEDLIVGFGVLCHDLGKPKTTFTDQSGHIRSPKHEIAGVGIGRMFLERMTSNKSLIHSILPLIETHMRPIALYLNDSGDAAIRRLAQKVRRIDRLLRVVSADLGGTPLKNTSRFTEGMKWLKERAETLNIKDHAPKPIIMGRHLLKLGLEPNPKFKAILDHCFEAQLEGEFQSLSEGLVFLKTHLRKKGMDYID